MEGKIAVLGDADFVMPFSALGLDTFATGTDAEEVTENARKIIAGKYSLIVVSETVAEACEEVFSSQQKNPLPCIVVVPFTTESQGFATRSLGEALKLATGVDILQNS